MSLIPESATSPTEITLAEEVVVEEGCEDPNNSSKLEETTEEPEEANLAQVIEELAKAKKAKLPLTEVKLKIMDLFALQKFKA